MAKSAESQAVLRLLIGGLLIGGRLGAQESQPFEGPPIRYSETTPDDPAMRLNAEFARRSEEIRDWPAKKRLRWLLGQLDVPVESQILVFSKTSLQRDLINPQNPRALYFSDEAYVGWVPGGAFEVTVFDPALGPTFYKLDAHEPPESPLLARSTDCLSCHSRHQRTPSLRARSVFPDPRGEPLSGSSSANIEPTTPLADRWGGWYVTGTPGALRHQGNITGAGLEDFEGPQGRRGATLPDLQAFFPATRHLLPTSDIVALLMHDHQVHVHNVIATANQESRLALHRWPAMRAMLGLPADSPPAGSCLVVFNSQAEKIIEALLFREEASFPPEGVHGNGDFEKAYARTRKPDGQGRSLRDLDLKTRLFRYRCSPLIYSRSFAGLPAELRDVVLRRLDQGLRAAQPGPEFAHLPAAERTAIHEILAATLSGLPAGWGKR